MSLLSDLRTQVAARLTAVGFADISNVYAYPPSSMIGWPAAGVFPGEPYIVPHADMAAVNAEVNLIVRVATTAAGADSAMETLDDLLTGDDSIIEALESRAGVGTPYVLTGGLAGSAHVVEVVNVVDGMNPADESVPLAVADLLLKVYLRRV